MYVCTTYRNYFCLCIYIHILKYTRVYGSKVIKKKKKENTISDIPYKLIKHATNLKTNGKTRVEIKYINSRHKDVALSAFVI